MHPTSPDDHARTTPAFAGLSPSELRDLTDWAAARPSHAPVCFLPAVRSAAGALAQGWLVSLTDTPASFRERPRDEVVRDVRAAAETARRLGADVLGLGAFTSIVTRNGDDLHDLPLAVTTGNALTVALAIEGVAHATGRLGRDLDRSRGCVLGLGAVGSAAASLLAERVPDLVLCGNPVRAERDARRALELADAIYARAARDLGRPEARGVARALREASLRWLAQGPADRRRLRALLARLRSLGKSDGDVDGLALEVAWACAQEGSAAPVRFESARGPALRAADVVVSATSDPGGVIGPAELRRGAVVCDVARPADVGAVVVAARPDVLVFEGGLARWPEAVSFGQHLGYAPGVALACLTETVVLALDGVTAGRFGRVSSLAEEARSIRAAAARHGFGLAELHRAGRPITDAELDAVKRAARPRHQTAA